MKNPKLPQREVLIEIEHLFSEARLKSYKLKSPNNWFSIYKKELKRGQELYIYLHFLEIFLRNKINQEFSLIFGNWLIITSKKPNLNFKEKERIADAIITLKRAKKILSQDNLVSNLSFGFWTNLFHKSYNFELWQENEMIEKIFPYFKSHERRIINIHKQMDEIRKLRNRIFHFENLQGWNIDEMCELIEKFIYGISGLKMDEILDNN